MKKMAEIFSLGLFGSLILAPVSPAQPARAVGWFLAFAGNQTGSSQRTALITLSERLENFCYNKPQEILGLFKALQGALRTGLEK